MKWFGPLCSPAAARWLVSLVLVGGDLRGLNNMGNNFRPIDRMKTRKFIQD